MRVVDLFCGAGGLSEGFRQAGFGVVAGAELDPDALATFRVNFPEAEAIAGDIRDPAVKARVLAAARRSDVVVGGPPCQGFSQVRNHSRLIDDPRNALYREFVDVVRHASPPAFVMENVPGMDQMGVKAQVLEDLSVDGRYRVSSAVLDAADFGVPQTRERIIFVGVRDDLGTAPPAMAGSGVSSKVELAREADGEGVQYRVRLTEPSHEELQAELALTAGTPWDMARLLDPDDTSAVTVEQAIGDLQLLERGRRNDTLDVAKLPAPTAGYQVLMRAGASHNLTNVQVPRMNKDTVLRLAAIPPGGNHRDLPERLMGRYLTGQKWGPHNGSNRLSRKHYYAYRRLHHSMWAWTLNTKADSAYHYTHERALSVREFARLQSFPDRFQFTTDPRKGELSGRIEGGPAHSRYRQVGNAVPPLLARAVAERVRASMEAALKPSPVERDVLEMLARIRQHSPGAPLDLQAVRRALDAALLGLGDDKLIAEVGLPGAAMKQKVAQGH